MKKITLILTVVAGMIFCSSITLGYGQVSNVDNIAPKITIPQDIYVKSKIPTEVSFVVKALDETDGKVTVNCDRMPNSVFKVGKTTVRCEAVDSSGNVARASFIVTVGYQIVQIPSWVKNTTEFWVNDKIDDTTYTDALGFLIKKDIIKVPLAKMPNYSDTYLMPSWIKTSSVSWVDGKISNDEYSIVLQWMINRNVIKI